MPLCSTCNRVLRLSRRKESDDDSPLCWRCANRPPRGGLSGRGGRQPAEFLHTAQRRARLAEYTRRAEARLPLFG